MSMPSMPHIAVPAGDSIPVLGQGTWHMAERHQLRSQEVAALRLGVDMGMTLIDTAEMYAHGGAEELVGDAIEGHRDEVYLVSKVLPSNATRRGTVKACEASLRRLRTDRLDLYLLHWPGSIPLSETVEAFVELTDRGLIRHWGVSNFEVADLTELWNVPGGTAARADQVLYNLARRGAENAVLPWCRERNLLVMAYSPLEQGRIVTHGAVRKVAQRHDVSPAQVALAWVLRQGACAIPKSGSTMRVRDNAAAASVDLTEEDLRELDAAFPRPDGDQPMEIL